MKTQDCSECKVHVLVCTNERQKPKTGCKDFGGQEFYLALKTKLKESGLYATHWVTRTGCLGFCNQVGTTVVIQPKGRPSQWYNEVRAEDFDFIWGEIVRQ